MEQQQIDAISFEDAIGIWQQRHKEITAELRHLRQELRDRDVVIKGLQARLGAKSAVELENRKLQQELRQFKDGLARLLQQEPHLRERLTAMAAAKAEDVTVTDSRTHNVQVDAIRSLASPTKNCVARLPFEMRGDIFMSLDRFSLDRAGFACPQFHSVVNCLVGGSLRKLSRVCLEVRELENRRAHLIRDSPPPKRKRSLTAHAGTTLDPAEEDIYEFRVSVDYSSDPLAQKNGTTKENVSRRWIFSDTDDAASNFIGILRHASVTEALLNGPLPARLLQALSAADADITIGGLDVGKFALKAAHLAVARSGLSSFSSLRRLSLWDDVAFDLLTDDLLLRFEHIGVVSVEFRSQLFWVRVTGGGWGGDDGRRVLVNTYDGDYPDLDAGLTAFLFRGRDAEHEAVALKFPAARVPRAFCERLLKEAIADGSRSTINLSFVAVVDDLKDELEEFQEFASQPDEETIVYKVPQSPGSDMLLELKIIALEDAPNGWRLVEFRRYKKCPPSSGAGGGGDPWGGFGGGWGGGGDGWGGDVWA